MGASAAAAVIVARERHIVEAFERLGATSATRGIDPATIGAHTAGVAWRRLLDRQVVREIEPGSGVFYVDLDQWRALRRLRRKVAVIALAIAAIVIAVAGYAGVAVTR